MLCLLRRIEAATKIWAAGVESSPLGRLLAEAAGVDIDRAGRVKVEPDCTLPERPEVFVIGDLMSLDQLPGVAQIAIYTQPRRAASPCSIIERGLVALRGKLGVSPAD